MKQISIEELKRNAGQWVKLASSREPIIITDDGKPVATLSGFKLNHRTTQLPDREEKISKRSRITVDSADYLSEMRD